MSSEEQREHLDHRALTAAGSEPLEVESIDATSNHALDHHAEAVAW